MKRSELGVGAKSLARGSTFATPRSQLRRTAAKPKRPPRIPGWSLAAKGEVRCRNCPRRAEHPHHAVPRSMSRAGRANLRNCLPLCAGCHGAWHDGAPIPRSVFTADEWTFIASIATQTFLDRHYPEEA